MLPQLASGGGDAEAEEGEAGLEQDGVGDLQRRVDDEDVDASSAGRGGTAGAHAGAHAARGDDEVALAQFEQAGADHARQHRPGQQRDDDDGGPDAGAGDRGEHEQEDHRRQRHGEIDERMATPSTTAAAEGGDGADEEADDESRCTTEETATSSEMRPP